jgi:hypothetical protein
MTKRMTALLVVINMLGIALYLLFASRGWRDPTESDLIPTTGEPYVWASSLPFLGLAVLTDVAWGVMVVVKPQLGGRRLYVLCIFFLFAAIVVDFAHH